MDAGPGLRVVRLPGEAKTSVPSAGGRTSRPGPVRDLRGPEYPVTARRGLAVAPARTGSVACTVTGPGGISDSVIYTYLTAPALTALSPAQGPTGAGAAVTLTGTGLTTTFAVRFGKEEHDLKCRA